MPRTREFNPTEALERAMTVFWEKGYLATSVEDLVDATGVNRFGLYAVWESKRGLYLAALRHYRLNVIAAAVAELEQPDAGLDAIHAVFQRLVHRVGTGEAESGCLLCHAAEELAPFDQDVAKEVYIFQRRLNRGFTRAVATAQREGALPADVAPREMGRYLAGLIQSGSFLARSPAGPRVVADFIRVGLRVLG